MPSLNVQAGLSIFQRGEEPSHAAMEQAAEWFALLRSGDATGEDSTRWQIWLDASAENQHAWSYVESVSCCFMQLAANTHPHLASKTVLAANDRTRQRRRALTGLLFLGGTGALSWLGWYHTPLQRIAASSFSDYHTGVGEVRDVRLNDGTKVWLNANTAFDKDFSSTFRRLNILTGEILIETAADAERPFMVDTVHGRMRALGTKFTVRLTEDNQTFLAVYQGAVEVETKTHQKLIVPKGKQIYFSADSIERMISADIAREAWSRGILVAKDITLREVVSQLGQYRQGYLGVAPAIADLRVFGSFPLNDTDEALSMLTAILPIHIKKTFSWWVSIEEKQDS